MADDQDTAATETEVVDERAALQGRIMKAVDTALEPAERLASTAQPMNTAHLRTVVTSVRQAIAALVYGPPAEPEEEPRVEDPKADAAASLVAGKSEPQFPAGDGAEGEKPADGETKSVFE